MGWVVPQAATANVATTARNSGLLMILFEIVAFLMVLFPTRIDTKSCASVKMSCNEIACARNDLYRQTTPHIGPALCATVHSEVFLYYRDTFFCPSGHASICSLRSKNGPEGPSCSVRCLGPYKRGSPRSLTLTVGPGGAAIWIRCSWPRKSYVTSQ